MTYVTEQTSAELRAHMRRLKKMAGWHEPLADRLFAEVLALDAEVKALREAAVAEPVEGAEPAIVAAATAYGNALACSAMDTKTLKAELICVIRAALHPAPASAQAGAVPDGWQLVPVEPTQEMVSAYLQANDAYWKRTDELPNKNASRWREGKPNEATAESYRAMLLAAPKAGAGESK